MKKVAVLLGFLVILSAGCGNKDKEDEGYTFTPPAWIIGSWSDSSHANNYKFNTGNIIFNSTTDFNATYGELDGTSEDSTETYYAVNLPEISYVYKFKRLTSTSLAYSIIASGKSIGAITLYKK